MHQNKSNIISTIERTCNSKDFIYLHLWFIYPMFLERVCNQIYDDRMSNCRISESILHHILVICIYLNSWCQNNQTDILQIYDGYSKENMRTTLNRNLDKKKNNANIFNLSRKRSKFIFLCVQYLTKIMDNNLHFKYYIKLFIHISRIFNFAFIFRTNIYIFIFCQIKIWKKFAVGDFFSRNLPESGWIAK